MKERPHWLGLYGPQGTGKTTLAKHIEHLKYNGGMELRWRALAQPMRDMLKAMGVEEQFLRPDGDKLAPQEVLCGKGVREAMQTLGTEWGRGFIGENVWLQSVETWVRNQMFDALCDGVVICDVRFDNERDFIKSRGGMLVRVNRTDIEPEQKSNHSSERDWKEWEPDFIAEMVHGEESLWDCAHNVLRAFEEHLK